jgi:hypothetical protein
VIRLLWIFGLEFTVVAIIRFLRKYKFSHTSERNFGFLLHNQLFLDSLICVPPVLTSSGTTSFFLTVCVQPVPSSSCKTRIFLKVCVPPVPSSYVPNWRFPDSLSCHQPCATSFSMRAASLLRWASSCSSRRASASNPVYFAGEPVLNK